MTDLSGAYDYLSVAVKGINDGVGTIQNRLGSACVRLFLLEDEAVPSDLRQEFAALKERMHRIADGIHPAAELTAAQMTTDECEQIAQRLAYILDIVTARRGAG